MRSPAPGWAARHSPSGRWRPRSRTSTRSSLPAAMYGPNGTIIGASPIRSSSRPPRGRSSAGSSGAITIRGGLSSPRAGTTRWVRGRRCSSPASSAIRCSTSSRSTARSCSHRCRRRASRSPASASSIRSIRSPRCSRRSLLWSSRRVHARASRRSSPCSFPAPTCSMAWRRMRRSSFARATSWPPRAPHRRMYASTRPSSSRGCGASSSTNRKVRASPSRLPARRAPSRGPASPAYPTTLRSPRCVPHRKAACSTGSRPAISGRSWAPGSDGSRVVRLTDRRYGAPGPTLQGWWGIEARVGADGRLIQAPQRIALPRGPLGPLIGELAAASVGTPTPLFPQAKDAGDAAEACARDRIP